MRENVDVVRAWKDETYRHSLGEAERAHLPQNPAGDIALSDDEARGVVGAFTAVFGGCPWTMTMGTCCYVCDSWDFGCGTYGAYTIVCCGS